MTKEVGTRIIFNKNKQKIVFKPTITYIDATTEHTEEIPLLSPNKDVALLIAIGYKYLGNNSYIPFVTLACKMLNIKLDTEWMPLNLQPYN